MKLEFFVVTDKAGIVADGHKPDIALAADQHAHGTAVFSGLPAKRLHIDDARVFRQALGNIRQLTFSRFSLK